MPRIIFDHLFAAACGDPRSRPFGTILRGGLEADPKPEREWRELRGSRESEVPEIRIAGSSFLISPKSLLKLVPVFG